jgi:hypothetical protein
VASTSVEHMFEFEGSPGPELVSELAGTEVAALSPMQRSFALSGVARMESWLAAKRCELLLALGDDFEHRLGGGNAADEMMAANRVSAWAAERAVRLARSAGRAPALLPALESGRLGVPHAHRLSQHLEDLADADAAAVADAVCGDERLETWSVGEVGRAAAKAAAELDAEAAIRRRRRKQKEANVYLEPAADAMAWLTLYGPAEELDAAYAAVAGRARAARRAEAAAGKERTPLGVLRFHEAVRLLLSRGTRTRGTQRSTDTETPADAPADAPADGEAGADSDAPAGNGADTEPQQRPAPTGSTVVTRVTVPWTTLIGLDEAPGDLAGYGPIPAPVARHLAVHRVVADAHRSGDRHAVPDGVPRIPDPRRGTALGTRPGSQLFTSRLR